MSNATRPDQQGRGLLPAALLCLLFGLPVAEAQDAASLRARHAELGAQLEQNPFRRPLHLESHESPGALRGDIYSRLEQPFAVASRELGSVEQWCDILNLHLNVKSCHATTNGDESLLSLRVGRKFDRPLEDAYPFDFRFRRAESNLDYLNVELYAADGPFGTREYRIALEVVEIDPARCFLHLSYSYGFGLPARVAMQGYLATIGRDKVGFTVSGTDANGEPVYEASTRGVVERNTMRYYLAIEAYLGALAVPAPEREEKRLQDWFSGIERYPVQLHEMERDQYIEMKHRERARQLAVVPGTPQR